MSSIQKKATQLGSDLNKRIGRLDSEVGQEGHVSVANRSHFERQLRDSSSQGRDRKQDPENSEEKRTRSGNPRRSLPPHQEGCEY